MVNQKAFIFRLAGNIALFAIFFMDFWVIHGGNGLMFAIALSNFNSVVPSGMVPSKTRPLAVSLVFLKNAAFLAEIREFSRQIPPI